MLVGVRGVASTTANPYPAVMKLLPVALAVGVPLLFAVGCSAQASSAAPEHQMAPPTGKVHKLFQRPSQNLVTAGPAKATKKKTPKKKTSSSPSNSSAAAKIQPVQATGGTTDSGALNSGADLIIGGFIPGVPGFAGEQDVQDSCTNNQASVNPVLVANTGTTTASLTFNIDSTLDSNGMYMLTQQPTQAPDGGPTNDCNAVFEQGWVVDPGDVMTVEPGMTGIVYMMLGGAPKTTGNGGWIILGGEGQGWYQAQLVESSNAGFSALWMPGQDGGKKTGNKDTIIENGPVGMNLVQCGTNSGGGAYPETGTVVVDGDVQGDWVLPGSNDDWSAISYGWNQPLCFSAPDGT